MLGVIGHGVPHQAATACLPPLSRPSLGGPLHRFVLEALRWISRYGIETPELLAAFSIVCGDVTAIVAAIVAGANDDFAVEDARGAGDISVTNLLIESLYAP